VNGRRECMKYETFRRKVKELSGRTDKNSVAVRGGS
jgi:hypothetical protein